MIVWGRSCRRPRVDDFNESLHLLGVGKEHCKKRLLATNYEITKNKLQQRSIGCRAVCTDSCWATQGSFTMQQRPVSQCNKGPFHNATKGRFTTQQRAVSQSNEGPHKAFFERRRVDKGVSRVRPHNARNKKTRQANIAR